MMYQGIFLVITIALMAGYFYNLFYRSKKQIEYKNDVRWQKIESRATQISTTYYQGILVLIALGIMILLFLPNELMVRMDRVLFYGFYVIIFSSIIELFALKHFDKRM